MDYIQSEISKVCDEIKGMLLDKNRKYGNSALEPVRIFSQASPDEQIKVRIDDKLSRIKKGCGIDNDDEDVINDLIGYLVLLKVARQADKWDGSDIEPLPPNGLEDCRKIIEMYTSGDRFA